MLKYLIKYTIVIFIQIQEGFMEKFQKYSSRAIMLMALLWAILTFSGTLSVGQSYFMIGLISAYLGIQNIILLNMGQRSGKMPNKIAYQIERHGDRAGIMRYVCINILLYFIIGVVVMVCGWSIMMQ